MVNLNIVNYNVLQSLTISAKEFHRRYLVGSKIQHCFLIKPHYIFQVEDKILFISYALVSLEN